MPLGTDQLTDSHVKCLQCELEARVAIPESPALLRRVPPALPRTLPVQLQ